MTDGANLLDASALLALFFAEPGMDAVKEILPHAAIHAFTLAEVLSKLSQKGIPDGDDLIGSLGLMIYEDLSTGTAVRMAWWHARTRQWGLSMGDCLCLAVAEQQQIPVLTADRSWLAAAADQPVTIVDIRVPAPPSGSR